MQTSNRIILTDVDGVLLEWEHHFTEWMLQRSYFENEVGEGYVGKKIYPYTLKEGGESSYEMSERFELTKYDNEAAQRFGLTKTEIRKEIREFNKSAWMGTQQPLPDSQTWVKLLAAEGWTFIPITSQTSDIPAQKLRKKRLGELFGDHIFTNYHILDTGSDKDSALAEFHGTGLYWVEDKPKNAVAGLKYGLKPILIDHPYNRDFDHPDVIRVSNWKEIHQIVSGRK
jgi:FMN phosphatase YigB (HAD superfamily)